MAIETVATVPEIARRNGVIRAGSRVVPEEVPIAFSYGGSTHAVMMATPADLEDFAVGFSLTEGIISSMADVEEVSVIEEGPGLDVQVRLAGDRQDALRLRRRHMAGPVGCGLCGIESIEQAMRPVPDVSGIALNLTPKEIAAAAVALNGAQPLHAQTHAVHGAGFYLPGEEQAKRLVAIREDVGRHNALDKLAGAVTGKRMNGSEGVVVVTSRISVEMVQKTAILGSAVLIAISAPTALAIRTAEQAGMTLIALTRGEDFEIFTHSDRIITGVTADVA